MANNFSNLAEKVSILVKNNGVTSPEYKLTNAEVKTLLSTVLSVTVSQIGEIYT